MSESSKAWELLDILRRQVDTLSDRVMKLEEQRERHIRLIYDLERRVDALEPKETVEEIASKDT